ncbi:hypothetical protein FJR04_08235 [Anabaena sp. UHCC 0204]|nr:hypothetical protein [Anabaena sp. UHCC 0204]
MIFDRELREICKYLSKINSTFLISVFLICPLSPIPCNLFPVTCHLSPVTCPLFPIPYSLFPIPCE